jgi:predicted dehydrogenase
MSSKELGLAVIGSGRIGSLRAILSSGHPAIKFLGVSDININNAKKLAQRCNANKYTDNNYELISDPNVTTVIVSTSEHDHYDAVMHALELGKPVLVEKPIALNIDEADKMIKKSKETNTLFRVGYAQRFKRRYLSGKDQLVEGRIGNILSISARACNTRAQGY